MVPDPSSKPMPVKAKSIDEKARLFSLYMRPLVLDATLACEHGHVPHISDLDIAPGLSKPKKRVSASGAQKLRPGEERTNPKKKQK